MYFFLQYSHVSNKRAVLLIDFNFFARDAHNFLCNEIFFFHVIKKDLPTIFVYSNLLVCQIIESRCECFFNFGSMIFAPNFKHMYKEKGSTKTKKVENNDFKGGSKNHTTTTRLLTIINHMFF